MASTHSTLSGSSSGPRMTWAVPLPEQRPGAPIRPTSAPRAVEREPTTGAYHGALTGSSTGLSVAGHGSGRPRQSRGSQSRAALPGRHCVGPAPFSLDECRVIPPTERASRSTTATWVAPSSSSTHAQSGVDTFALALPQTRSSQRWPRRLLLIPDEHWRRVHGGMGIAHRPTVWEASFQPPSTQSLSGSWLPAGTVHTVTGWT